MEHTTFLKRAIELAKESVHKNGFPAGALVVKNGEIIAEGISIGAVLSDPTSHAETESIRKACKKLNTTNLEGAILYGSLQSCVMCFSASYWAGISTIVCACQKTPEMVAKRYYEGITDTEKLNTENNRKIELLFLPEFEKDSLAVVEEWEKSFGK